MARDRDDDSRDSRDDSRDDSRGDSRDDRRDDRPRRRGGDDAPKKGGKGWLIALIIVGGILLICGGIIAAGAYFLSQAVTAVSQAANNAITTVQAEVAAGNFLTTLQFGNVDGAYDGTTANFKATTSKDAFAKLVKDNPVLAATHHADPNGLAAVTGAAPNRKATARFVVNPSDVADEMNHVGSRTTGTGPKSMATKPVSTAPAVKGVSCTVLVAEQADGTWKVDGFTVQ